MLEVTILRAKLEPSVVHVRQESFTSVLVFQITSEDTGGTFTSKGSGGRGKECKRSRSCRMLRMSRA